jgi:hypothetical protein
MIRRGGFGLAAFAVAVAAAAAVAGAAPQAGSHAAASTVGGPSLVEAAVPVSGYDEVETRIDVQRGGDAEWRVDLRYELRDAADERAFQRASANVSNPPGVFVGRMQAAADRAENATGREMTVRNGSVSTRESLPDGRFGIVRYRFTWTNFGANPEGDRYVVGDAIGGLRLSENESLWIEWVDAFETESVSPSPTARQQRAVRWTGPMRFRTEDPTVELRAIDAAGGFPLVPVAAGVVVALAAVGAGVAWSRRTGEQASAEDDGGGVATDAAGEREAAGTADAATEGSASGPADAPDEGGEEANAGAADGPPEELLTDEERVLRLLEQADGRMKQQDLIGAVDWSRTKASDVVNEMHEAGQIEVYRLGRENVLALPGEIDV